jgi:hypothetical protein
MSTHIPKSQRVSTRLEIYSMIIGWYAIYKEIVRDGNRFRDRKEHQ